MNKPIDLPLERLSVESANGYGDLIRIPVAGEREPLLSSDFFNHYGPMAQMPCDGLFELGITTFKNRPLIVDKLEQHAMTAELLLALDGPMIIPIAKIKTEDSVAMPDERTIKALYIEKGEGIAFYEGMWHWAPFPAGDTEFSSVLVGFKADTAQDDIIIKDLENEYQIDTRGIL